MNKLEHTLIQINFNQNKKHALNHKKYNTITFSKNCFQKDNFPIIYLAVNNPAISETSISCFS
jgi:hypothetical protein